MTDDTYADENTPMPTNIEDTTPLPTFEEEVEVWRERSHILWLRAVADGDLRAMAAAVQVALKNLGAWQASITEEQEKAAQKATGDNDDPDDPRSGAPSVAWLDRIVRISDEHEAKALAGGEIRCPICVFSTVHPSRIAERFPDVVAAKERYEKSCGSSVANAAN